jgi:hypothetical protein
MSAPTSHSVPSLVKFVELIEQFQKAASGPLWFRGVGNANYHLEPSLFRLPPPRTVAGMASVESQLMAMFKQRSVIYGTRALVGEWEHLFFMQHHGVPTRLLDWSENPFIAFFFAVMSARKEKVGKTYDFTNDAGVWILDPIAWNRRALSHNSYSGGILSVSDDDLKGNEYRPNYVGMNNHPVCMFGIHNSQRIVNQRGVFSVFGQSLIAMEETYDTASFPVDSLRKIELPKKQLDDFRSSIVACGITDSVVYPDLGGLATEIKRHHGFEV